MTPTPALRPWIADVTLLRPDSALPLVHLPDAATALVYRRTGAGDGAGNGDLRVIGPRGRASYFPGKDLPLCIRIRLRPGAARPVFGVPVSELRDQAVPLADLWGTRAAHLEDRLNDLAGPGPVLRGIEDALLESLHGTTDSRDQLLRRAAESLSTTGERVGALARRLAVSERHLRDLFTDRIGLSPKHFARVQRVRTVLARAGSAEWAGLALDSGYYDQSHMTADFHTLMGVSPAAFRAGRLPAGTLCAG
ncbi:AraC family transcriptional regulator [Catenulispora sp. NF23]|uniref:AraC family transcriptional regulator n=1 Tax=Catenulispora pinistramenti TaxID=2705254 RepID=A0ABS5KZY9_9ACTN|nr:helix-turn-helix domain-containing protein [Catenulispora pinistramenti]MBS2539421.1 AraC family transcriptional regulator [Catenulispora pinistramenti]MBS2551646.1 AraC family transcriptional regulator [Catenulispora pinistramenti]